MIDSISLENFKCFNEKKDIPIAQITLMYGKNGRGKSTFAQALLLLSQTMKTSNDVESLQLMGDFVKLGAFKDVINSHAGKDEFLMCIKEGSDKVEMTFDHNPSKPQTGHLCGLVYNGENRFDTKADESLENTSGDKTAGAVSDITLLQNLKSTTFVSAGRLGPVNTVKRNDNLPPNRIGVDGEYVINVLANQGPDFLENVRDALSYILSGAQISVDQSSYDIDLRLGSVDGGMTYTPVNVGFGYSYILPVVVATLLAKEKSLLIIENPEAHLHPGAQSRMTKFLIQHAKSKNLQLIIETHSDHVVNGLRIAMKQKFAGISEDDAEIIYFSHSNDADDVTYEIIKCDHKGELSKYPDDFLDEWTRQLVDLM